MLGVVIHGLVYPWNIYIDRLGLGATGKSRVVGMTMKVKRVVCTVKIYYFLKKNSDIDLQQLRWFDVVIKLCA